MAEFDESKHPRDHGKFASSGGSSGGDTSQSAPDLHPDEEAELAKKLPDSVKESDGSIKSSFKQKIHAVRAAVFNATTKIASVAGPAMVDAVLPTCEEFIRSRFSSESGVSGAYEAMQIASHALAKVKTWLTSKKDKSTHNADEVSAHAADLLKAIYESAGIDGEPPSADELKQHVRHPSKSSNDEAKPASGHNTDAADVKHLVPLPKYLIKHALTSRPTFTKLAGDAYAPRPTMADAPKIDTVKMTITGIISTSKVDRSGDIVVCKGIWTENHRKNPIVLFDHGLHGYRMPIGVAEDDDGNYTVQIRDDHAIGTTHFSKSSDDAAAIFRLCEEGVLRGLSIGFRPLKIDFMPNSDPESPSLFIEECELLEYSHTPLPDNPDALRVRIEKGFGGKQFSAELVRALEPYAAKRGDIVRGFNLSKDNPMPTQTRRKAADDNDYKPLDKDGVAIDDKDKDSDDATDADKKSMGAEGALADGAAATEPETPIAKGPPGSQALTAAFDHFAMAKQAIEEVGKMQEHPRVQEILADVSSKIDEMSDMLHSEHSDLYPDLDPLKDEGHSEPDGDEDIDLDDDGGKKKKSLSPAKLRMKKRLEYRYKRMPGVAPIIKRLSKWVRSTCNKAADHLDDIGNTEDQITGAHKSGALYHASQLRKVATQGDEADEDEDPRMKSLTEEKAKIERELKRQLNANERLLDEIKKLRRGR